MSSSERERLVIGRVSGSYGVRGWVKIHSFTEPRENILAYGEIQLGRDGCWRDATLAEGRRQGKGLVARISGIGDRDQAAGLVGEDIAILRSQLPEAVDGDFYWVDLIGLEVVNEDDVSLGKVSKLIETGANDVLVVDGERERLIPFIRESVVKAVDLDSGTIRVDWETDY